MTDKTCFHGGAFFDAIGDEFDALHRHDAIVNADVLDAWFEPSPRVLDALQSNLPWILRTSPPTDCGGMVRVVAEARGVDPTCILPGAGSSALIFLAFSQWLKAGARTLLLDPTYGEYAHVLEHVIGCEVERFPLAREQGYRPDLEQILDTTHRGEGFDLIVLVNPNSPTGRHVPRADLEPFLAELPKFTRVWIDETYVEYASAATGEPQSLEQFAAASDNVVVCKSMSKVYALSGVRAAYLCASPKRLDTLRHLVPPWAVSLPAQIAAVYAMRDDEYYVARYRETHRLRDELAATLASIAPMQITPSCANFLLCELDPHGPTAAQVVAACRENGVFLRDASGMGSALSPHALRIAVKGVEDNAKITNALRRALSAS